MRDWHKAIVFSCFWIISYILLHLLAEKIKVPSAWYADDASIILSLIVFTFLALTMTVAVARFRFCWTLDICAFIIALSLCLICTLLKIAMVGDGLLVICSLFFGRMLARTIREPNILLPVGLVLIVVDVWTVALGPVGNAIEQAAQEPHSVVGKVTEAATVQVPMAGYSGTNIIGLGDFVFMGLFFTVLQRFSMNIRGSFLLCLILLVFGLLLVSGLNGLPLPGLPFLVVGVLVPNFRQLRFSQREWVYMGVAFTFLFGMLLIITKTFN